MDKLLSMVLISMPAWALAAAKEAESMTEKPAELVDMIYVVIFGVIFIGMIVGYCVYFWWAERKRKKSGGE